MTQLINNTRPGDSNSKNSLHPRIAIIEQHGGKTLEFHLTPTEKYIITDISAEYLAEQVSFSQCFPGKGNMQKGKIAIGVSVTPRALDVEEALKYISDAQYREEYNKDRAWSDSIMGFIDEIPSSGKERSEVCLTERIHDCGPTFPFSPDFIEGYDFHKTFRTYAYLNINPSKFSNKTLKLMEGISPKETMVWFGRFLVKQTYNEHYKQGRSGSPNVGGNYCRNTFNEVAYFRCGGEKRLGVLLIDNAQPGD